MAGSLEGCASPAHPPAPVIETVRPFISTGYGKKESAKASHFKLIDDFSSQDFKNRIGGKWQRTSTEGSTLDIRYATDEAVGAHGYALEVVYDLAKRGKGSIFTNLNGLDVSKAQGFSFWLSYTAGQHASFHLKLTSHSGRSSVVNITSKLRPGSKSWQEIFIPLSDWKGLDFNHFDRLEFTVEAGEREEGSFLIDQLSFFGDEDVFFESLKDNLRGFPADVDVDQRKLMDLKDEELLLQIAKDTWRYFDNIVDRQNQLPLDHIKLSWKKEIGDYTSPTNIGLYFVSVICASELGFITKADAVARIRSSLKTVEQLSKWKGFLYNYYNTTNLQTTSTFISSVDNGWFAIALMTVKAAFPKELGKRVDKVLKQMDFYEFYDMGEGKFHLGFETKNKRFSNSHYGMFISEARAMSYMAIAKGDVELEHWFRMFRVPPASWKWQSQVPEGVSRTLHDVEVFEGYYQFGGRKIVPSWGGSLFEFLMPTLFLKEQELAKENLGANNVIAAEIHRDYALGEKHYPVWGLSPCMTDQGPGSNYVEQGIKGIAVKGYRDAGVVTPHASILALEILPADVFENIRRLLNIYPIYGEYGFYDSVSVKKRLVSKQYLALDQGMILIAVTNYLKKGIIREKFHSLSETRKIESVLSEERFFAA